MICLTSFLFEEGFNSDIDHYGLRVSLSDHFLFFKDFLNNNKNTCHLCDKLPVSTLVEIFFKFSLELSLISLMVCFDAVISPSSDPFYRVFLLFSVIFLNLRLQGGFDHLPWNLSSRSPLVSMSVLNLC